MRKITNLMLLYLNRAPFKPPKWTKQWNAGCKASISMDWEHEKLAISANEVVRDLNKYLEKWPGKKKFHIDGNVRASVDYVR